jgi:preprotein translocase subunit SecF
MWFGIKREDLVSAETKAGASTTKSDDPNFGAQV